MSGRKRHAPKLRLALTLAAILACIQPAFADDPPLKIAGRFNVMERAPMELAVERLPPGSATISNGAIPALWPGNVDALYPGNRTEKGQTPPDLVGNSETQALRQSVPHPDLRILMTVAEGMYRMVARKSAGIQEIADLKGKRVATVSANSSSYFLKRMLARAGLTEADVTIVATTPDKGADMLIAGTVDALAVFEPEPERARQALGANAVELHEFGVYRELYNLNTTTATLNNPIKRRQTVAYVRELLAACHDATHNPARAQALAAKSSGYDLKLVQAAWHHHRFSCSMPTDMLDVLVEEEKWIAASEKRQPRNREQLKPLIDRSILDEARKK